MWGMLLRRRSSRRAILAALAVASACDATPFREKRVDVAAEPAPVPAAPTAARVLRFSVAAMESPRDTYSAYSRLFERMGEQLGVTVDFVQRRTYREVNDLLA